MKKSELRQLIREEIKKLREKKANKKFDSYDEFFKAAAKEFGYDPEKIDNLSKEKKKEFYDYLDANWQSDKED